MMLQQILLTILLVLFFIVITVPPVIFLVLYLMDKKQTQHSVLRSFPLLGRVRYFFEMMGPEMRQYMFDSDNEGKLFS